MTLPRLYELNINPEPWEMGTVTSGFKNGKRFSTISPNDTLVAYQNAVKEALEDFEPLDPAAVLDAVKLTFFFWRQRTKYINASDRIITKSSADSTNLGKGLEDALQGVLFKNDRIVRDVRSVIVAQGTDVEPKILIKVEAFDEGKIQIEGARLLDLVTDRPIPKEEALDQWQDSGELF